MSQDTKPDPSSVNVPRDAYERLRCNNCGHSATLHENGTGSCCWLERGPCMCEAFESDPPVPVSDEAEAGELRQLSSAYLAAWGNGIPKLWRDAFTALGIEPMDDIRAAFDLAQSLAARLAGKDDER